MEGFVPLQEAEEEHKVRATKVREMGGRRREREGVGGDENCIL